MTASPTSPSSYCWIVAIACFWLNFCLLGVMKSSAVVFVALIEDFGLTREDAAWPSGIFGFCMCFTGALSGFITEYFSNRSMLMVGAGLASVAVSLCSVATNIKHITILYGVLQGAGFGIVVPMTHVTLNQHFHRYRALATGIAYSGSSVGSFLLPAMTHYMLEEFGLSGTLLLLGGVMLQSLIGIALIKPAPTSQTSFSHLKTSGEAGFNAPAVAEETNTKQYSIDNGHVCELYKDLQSKVSNCKEGKRLVPEKLRNSLCLTIRILKSPTFLLISATFAFYFSVSATYLMVIFDFALDCGIHKEHGVFLVSTFSFGDLTGKLLCGWIGDLSCIPRKSLVCGYLLAMGGILVIVPLYPTFMVMAITSVILGILNGGILVNYSAVFAEHMGLEKLPLAIGFSSCLTGILAPLRPVVIGYFRDKHQSYGGLFQFLGIAQILITFTWLFQDVLRYFRTLLKNFKSR